jgi:molybdopterin-guanine dinucleotide biosynthesis protein
MSIMSLAGWSSSGKSTLIGKLAGRYAEYAQHSFDLDKPDKDSFESGR